MVESLGKPDLFPRTRIVTRLAGILECAVMRVGVTIRALLKCESDEFHNRLRASDRDMAFRASDACVSSSQTEFRVLMIEFRRRFPTRFRMTTRAIGAELPFVFVRMASIAFTREAQECTVQILNDDRAPLACGNILRFMTLTACEAGMPANERVARFRVIK